MLPCRSRSTLSHFRRLFSGSTQPIPLTFLNPDGSSSAVVASPGKTLLEVAIENDLDVEGACEGSLACSTCHMIFQKNVFEQLDPASEEEMDLLDLAVGLESTSRLGCQITVDQRLEGAVIRLPEDAISALNK